MHRAPARARGFRLEIEAYSSKFIGAEAELNICQELALALLNQATWRPLLWQLDNRVRVTWCRTMEERKLREMFERHASDGRAIAAETLAIGAGMPTQLREFSSLCSVFSLKAWLNVRYREWTTIVT